MSRNAIATLWWVTVVLCVVASKAMLAQQPGPLPGWFDADIGTVGQPGSSSQSDDTFRVSGAGADIWGPSDSFHFTYTNLPGDGDLYVLARSQTADNPFAKAGVMIRQSIDPSSPFVILDIKPDGGIEFMGRFSPGGNVVFMTGSQQSYPLYLRLTRRGQYVAAFISDASRCPGMGCNSWTNISGWHPWAGGAALIGLAVTSHDPTTLNTAVLDFWDLTRLNAPWQQTDLYDETEPDSAFTIPGSSGQPDTYIVPGAGSDIWGTSDSFKFVWQFTTSTDLTLTARADARRYTDPFAKAGIMMRSSLMPSSPSVLLDVKPDGGIEFMTRQTGGASTTFVAAATASGPAWLRLTKSGDQYTASTSPDGTHWTAFGTTTASLSPNGASVLPGLAATSHGAPTAPNWGPSFDNVSIVGTIPTNLISDPGFEAETPPNLAINWHSDRQVFAGAETAEPHTGKQNVACRANTSQDCGLFQEVTAPATGTYTLQLYANADRTGALVGANVNGATAASAAVEVRGTGHYGSPYTFTFQANQGDAIRVWMYSPATPGSAVLDDVSLAFTSQ